MIRGFSGGFCGCFGVLAAIVLVIIVLIAIGMASSGNPSAVPSPT